MDIKLSWGLGIDMVSDRSNLSPGSVVDAVNVNIDRSGGVGRRDGRELLLSVAGAHDAWTSPARGDSFAIVGGALCKITVPWSVTPLYTLAQDLPFSYCDLNGDVIASSRAELLVIKPDLSVRRLGLDKPGAPGLYGYGEYGGIGVAISYLRGDEVGPLSRVAFGSTSITLPQPTESLPTGIRVYCTGDSGDLLYRNVDVPLGVTSITINPQNRGEPANHQFMDRMIPGDMVRPWRGTLWTVRGNILCYSDDLRYEMYDPRFNYITMPHAVRLFEPVEGGIYVGGKDGIYFLRGKNPRELEVEKRGGAAPIKGTGTQIPASIINGEEADSGQMVAVWLSGNGYVIGMPDGRIIEKQRKYIKLDDSSNTGAVVVHDRQVTAVVS